MSFTAKDTSPIALKLVDFSRSYPEERVREGGEGRGGGRRGKEERGRRRGEGGKGREERGGEETVRGGGEGGKRSSAQIDTHGGLGLVTRQTFFTELSRNCIASFR